LKSANFLRVLTTILLITRDMHMAINNPSQMDSINGLLAGLVLYLIWREGV